MESRLDYSAGKIGDATFKIACRALSAKGVREVVIVGQRYDVREQVADCLNVNYFNRENIAVRDTRNYEGLNRTSERTLVVDLDSLLSSGCPA